MQQNLRIKHHDEGGANYCTLNQSPDNIPKKEMKALLIRETALCFSFGVSLGQGNLCVRETSSGQSWSFEETKKWEMLYNIVAKQNLIATQGIEKMHNRGIERVINTNNNNNVHVVHTQAHEQQYISAPIP